MNFNNTRGKPDKDPRPKGRFSGRGGAERGSRRPRREESFRECPEREERAAEDHIEGRNAVTEALEAGRPINKAWILKSGDDHQPDSRLKGLESQIRAAGIPILYLDRAGLDRLSNGGQHQGVIIQLAAKDYADAAAVLDQLETEGREGLILILDGLQDGRNLGAALRVAEACAVDLVVIPERRSVSLDAYVAKAAAGALEHVPVARETNLSRFIEEIKARGYWVFGSAVEGETPLRKAKFRGKTAIVVGSEGKGMAQKLRERCDHLLKIPMYGRLNSLNASVACGILCFEAAAQRHEEEAQDGGEAN